MRSVFPVLSVLALAVSAAPLLFTTDLLKKGDNRLDVLNHAVYHLNEEEKPVGFVFGASHPVVRFLYLLPKAAHTPTLSKEGFSSKLFGGELLGGGVNTKYGHAPKHHPFLDLSDNELLHDLLAVSDCRKWHAVFLRLWDAAAGLAHHRLFTGLLGPDHKFKLTVVDKVAELAEFVRYHAGAFLLPGLLKKRLVAHVFTHHLAALV